MKTQRKEPTNNVSEGRFKKREPKQRTKLSENPNTRKAKQQVNPIVPSTNNRIMLKLEFEWPKMKEWFDKLLTKLVKLIVFIVTLNSN